MHTKNQLIFVFSILFYFAAPLANAVDDSRCQQFFANRPDRTAVDQAISCYAQIESEGLASPTSERLAYLESRLLILGYATTTYTQTRFQADQRNWVDQALPLLGHLQSAIEQIADPATKRLRTGAFHYWRFSFVTFDSLLKDGLPMLTCEDIGWLRRPPENIIGALAGIQRDMQQAAQLNAPYHGYGAYRNQGLMYLSMPASRFTGVDRMALTLLQRAYNSNRYFSMNVIYYARGLIKQNRRPEAEIILRQFISEAQSNLDQYGADRRPDTLQDILTAQRMLGGDAC